MHFQHLNNFITKRVRPNDIYVPAMILFLVKNEGWGTTEQIARLIYIFEYKHDLSHYETIVEKFASTILQDYGIIKKEEDCYTLTTWPLSHKEINDISLQCHRVAKGFFTNLKIDTSSAEQAS